MNIVMKSIRVGTFDPAPLFRLGLAHALTGDGMRVVADGARIEDAISAAAARKIDVVIADGAIAGWPGDAARVLAPLIASTRVLLVTDSATDESVRAAFAAGVLGCISRAADAREVCDAIRQVSRNEYYLSPSLVASIMRKPVLSAPEPECQRTLVAQLSWREGQILKLIGAGLMNKEIAHRLDLSEKSVKRYVTGIFEKLHVRNRVEAALVCGTSDGQTNKASLALSDREETRSAQQPLAVRPGQQAALGGRTVNSDLGTHIVLTSTAETGDARLSLWSRS